MMPGSPGSARGRSTRGGGDDVQRRKVVSLVAVLVIAASVALIAASAALGSAQQYCNQYLVGDGASCSSGWNYWFATDVTKDPHFEWLGMHNDAGVDKHVTTSGTYKYTDRTILGMGGYMHAYVIKKSSGSAYNNADVCTC